MIINYKEFFYLVSGVCELSALLLNMMETLGSPLCNSWATPHVWLYVIKHYITAIKEAVNENVSKTFFFFFSFSIPTGNHKVDLLKKCIRFKSWSKIVLSLP